MSRFLKYHYQAMEAYTPGEQPRDMQYIKLNTNESPYPPAPSVVAAMDAEQAEFLRLYPDPTAKNLKEKLAGLYDVAPENVFVSNGSDEVLNFAFMAFGENGVVFPDISYGFYEVYAQLYALNWETAPLEAVKNAGSIFMGRSCPEAWATTLPGPTTPCPLPARRGFPAL